MWTNDATFHLIRRILQQHNSLWREELPELTPVQFSVLLSINNLPNHDQKTIAAASAVDATTLAELIRRLVKIGYVVRAADKDDGRRQMLSLTDLGQETLRRSARIVRKIRDESLQNLSTDNIDELRMLLQKADLSYDATKHHENN